MAQMNYKYKISFTYVHKVGKNKYDSYKYGVENVNGCIIHSDYIKNNMPLIILDISIRNEIANLMVDTNNISNDYVILEITKFNLEDDMQIELPYISDRFNYYTFTQLDKNAAVDFAEENPMDSDLLVRSVQLGLVKADSMKSNSITFNGTIKNTTPQSLIQNALNQAGLDTVVEQFTYNPLWNRIIIPPLTSLSKIIKHLNGISVFYSTPYRFFIDFDVAYLLSSSGSMVVKKGDLINSIVFDVGDVTEVSSRTDGMYILKNQNVYYVPVTFGDCQLADDYISSQQYSNITAITRNGSINVSPNMISGDNASVTTTTMRIPNDNKNMAQNIAAAISNSSTLVSIYKVGVDNSVFTPNKEYSIKYGNTYDESHNGNYLLNSKQEVFNREGAYFTAAVMLSLARINT